jgi:hypothetical protein
MLDSFLPLVALLLFLPGIAVFEFLDRKLAWKLTLLEKVVAGSIFWNGAFALASVVFGMYSGLLGSVYWVFGILSSILLGVLVILRIAMVKVSSLTFPHLSRNVKLCLLFLLPIVIVISVISLHVRLWTSWDVWAVWLPASKSIIARGDLLYQTFFLSKEIVAVTPPFVPLLYSWTSTISGGDFFQFLPIIYYVLLGFASYLLCRAIFEDKRIAIGAVIISTTSMVGIATLFGYTLHPDIPTAFFICTAMYYMVKLLKGDTRTVNVLLLGTSLSLLLLSQVIGLLIAYVFISFLLLCLRLPFRKGFFVLAFLFPMVFLLVNAKYFEFLPLLVLYGLGLILIVKRTTLNSNLKMWKALTVLIPILPTAFYLYSIGKLTGIWAYGAVVSSSFQSAYDLLRSLAASSQNTLSFMDAARLDDIFFRFSFIALLLLFLVGLFSVARKRDASTSFLIIIILMFLTVFLQQPRMFYPSLSSDVGYIRRYLYIVPVVAIFAAKGFEWLYQSWGSIRNRTMKRPFFIASLILYCSLSTVYLFERTNSAWPYPLSSLSVISELQTSLAESYATAFDLVVLGAILLLCLEIPKLICFVKAKVSPAKMRKLSSVLLVLVACSSLLVVYSLRAPLGGIAANGDTTRLALPADAQELVTYFNGLKDNGVVIGFSKYFLVTFANRQIIDLSMPSCVITFKEVFQNVSLPVLTDALSSRNIRYIIVPKSQQLAEFEIFTSIRAFFPSLGSLFASARINLDKSLTNFDIYRILTPDEYAQYLQNLSYYYNYKNNPIVISGDNQSLLYKTSIENITLSDNSLLKVSGDNALEINISGLQQTTGIDNKISPSLDFTGKDFVSFYWYGNGSNIPLSIRFQTGSWRDQFSFKFIDSWNGWAKLIIPLNAFSVQAGTPDWANVTLAAFVFEGQIANPSTFYLDQFTVDTGVANYHFIPFQSLAQ